MCLYCNPRVLWFAKECIRQDTRVCVVYLTYTTLCMCIQWNPSIVGTLETWKSVLYREVSSFQVYIYIKQAYLGHSKVSLIQRCL